MDKLLDHLRQPELQWLLDRLVARLEAGKPLDTGRLSLKSPTPEQRRAIDDLMGRRSTRGQQQLTLILPTLCERLRIDHTGLRDIVVALRGPVKNTRAARTAEAMTWETFAQRWHERLEPEHHHWLSDMMRTGLLKRLTNRDPEEADRLLKQACTILQGAPHHDRLLAAVAAGVTGDSHALDRGRPLSTICLRAIGIDGPRREAWATLGITVDDLSGPTLCLNLRAAPDADQAPWVQWHAERGEPFYLTWR
ncbi:MAG: TIGR02679 domain-containing protein, partial [Verrucomicrobiota bacterium]